MKKLLLVLTAVFFCSMTITAAPKVSATTKATINQCARLTQPLLPMEVDEVTILWGINGEEDSLIYYYAIQYNSNDLDGETITSALKPTLVSTIKTSTDETIMTLRKLKITFEHRYYGNDGQLLCSIKVTPEDYAK